MATLSDLYSNFKELCMQWFYTKNEADNNFSDINHSHSEYLTSGSLTNYVQKSSTVGLIKNDGSIDSTSYVNTNDSRLSDARTPTAHNQASSTITDTNTYSNIGNSAQTQESINSAINTKLGTLSSMDVIKVVSDKGTASADTMNKLYIEISDPDTTDVYYTTENNGTYSWNKMDTDILDDLSVDWTDIQNNPFSTASPSDYATSNHSHGALTNNGCVTSVDSSTMLTAIAGIVSPQMGQNCIRFGSKLDSQILIDSVAHTNIGSSANDNQKSINASINTALGNKINKSNTSGLVKNDGSIDTTTYLSSLPSHTHGNITDSGTIGNLNTLSNIIITPQVINYPQTPDSPATRETRDVILLGDVTDNLKISPSSYLLSDYIQNDSALSNIGTSANATQYDINSAIDTALGNKALSSHTHGNIANNGTITQTGTNGGNLVVTNSSNAVVVESAIDVLDGIINDLIDYGES